MKERESVDVIEASVCWKRPKPKSGDPSIVTVLVGDLRVVIEGKITNVTSERPIPPPPNETITKGVKPPDMRRIVEIIDSGVYTRDEVRAITLGFGPIDADVPVGKGLLP